MICKMCKSDKYFSSSICFFCEKCSLFNKSWGYPEFTKEEFVYKFFGEDKVYTEKEFEKYLFLKAFI